MADEKRMTSFRLSARAAKKLEQLAGHLHADKTQLVEHGIELLAEPYLAAVFGGSTWALKQAALCWAEVLTRASADNEQTFARNEWNLMADANNGCSPIFTLAEGGDDPLGGPPRRLSFPPTILWANVADDIRLNGGDKKWKIKDPAGLVERLRGLDFVHAWAVIVAVQWFWEHCSCQVDHSKDVWWTVEFRKGHKCQEEE